MRFNLTSLLAAAAAALTLAASQSRAVVLYDGSTDANPTARGFLTTYATAPATISSSAGQTTLTTTGVDGFLGGISNHSPLFAPVSGSFPTLARTPGFRLSFDLSVPTETHSTVNDGSERSGFSVIVLGSDKKGIELGFWQSSVAAGVLNGANTAVIRSTSELASFDATAAHHYELLITGDNYALTVDGGPSALLSGAVRDYTPLVAADDPYEVPNFLFLGDRSINAQTVASLTAINVVVPEPASLGLLSIGTLALLRRRRAR